MHAPFPPPPHPLRIVQLLTGDLSWNPDSTRPADRYVSVKVENVDTPTPVTAFDDEWPRKGENTNARGHLVASAMAFRNAANFQQAEATFVYRNCVPSYQDWDGQTWKSAESAAMNIEAKCWAGSTSKVSTYLEVEVYYMAGPSASVYGYIPTDAAMKRWGEAEPSSRVVQWSDLAPFPKEMWGLVVVVVKVKGTTTIIRTATLGWSCKIVAKSKAAEANSPHPCRLVSVADLSNAVGFPLLPGVDDSLESNVDNTLLLPKETDCSGTTNDQTCKAEVRKLHRSTAACNPADATKALFANVKVAKNKIFTVVN